MRSSLCFVEDVYKVLRAFPLASLEIQKHFQPGWELEDSEGWNSIHELPNNMVAMWMEDGPDNGDGLGRGGLFVFPKDSFIPFSKAKGYYIDTDKPGWKLRFFKLLEGKVLSGVERVG